MNTIRFHFNAMQTSRLFAMMLVCFAVSARSQGAGAGATNSSTLPMPTPYTIVSRDAHSAIWQQQEYQRRPNGTIVTNNHRYVELATGLNHLVGGKYVPSTENIVISPDASSAMATNGQHQVYFPGNIYSGQIKLVTPDGQVMQSQPIGLSYFDGSNSVLLAVVTNATGAILPSGNQVIYTNAFVGLNADLLYTYTKAGMEQDVVLRQQPPDPASLGLNSAGTRLQILTEFISAPQPVVTATTAPTAAGNLENDALSFGAMQMGQGKAFLLGTNSPSVNVEKRWLTLNGRQFLIEEVPIVSISQAIDSLPPVVGQAGLAIKPVVSKNLILPPPRLVQSQPQSMPVAQAAPPKTGLVLDYVTLNYSTNNFTFQGDTTYYISGGVNLGGTITFEGGTVLKYAVNASVHISSATPVNWLAGPYRPVIMTALDDNTVGETISGSTGKPTNYYAYPALDLTSAAPTNLCNFRIAYAQIGIQPCFPYGLNLYDGQVVNCQTGISTVHANFNAENMLFANVQTAFNISMVGVSVVNTTFSSNNILVEYNYNPAGVTLTNCILANVSQLTDQFSGSGGNFSGDYNGFYNADEFGSDVVSDSFYPFQASGAGYYYLTNGCRFITNAGTANIDPMLLADLQTRTVYSPALVYSNTTKSGTWTPQVQRDTNAAPSLGYHYAPIDYAVSGVNVGGTLTLNNGVAVATLTGSANCAPGLIVHSGDQLTSVGTATTHNQLCSYAAVQEQSTPWGGNALRYTILMDIQGSGYWTDPPAVLYAQFTDFNGLAGLGTGAWFATDQPPGVQIGGGDQMEFTLKDCRVGPGSLACDTYQGTDTSECFNNLFDRGGIAISDFDGDCPVTMGNNLFHNGYVSFDNENQTYTWAVQNNFFDHTALSAYGALYQNHNGYWNTTQLTPTNANDVVVTNFIYATGPFGNYYQVSTNLLNKGNTTAAALGLYHYTVQTNIAWNSLAKENSEVAEGTSQVSIGYHYVATDAYGNPLDSNGNGIPDYLEDPNGNGQSLRVTLVAPVNNSYFREPATIPMQATVFDWSGTVTNVTFSSGPTNLTTLANPPFNCNWPIVAAGSYTVQAKAFDNNGGTANSSTASVTVTNLCH